MKEKLRRLAERGLYVGTSSWKYLGWKGLIYLNDYSSEKAFNERCLEEYSTTFSTVGVDHTYYNWPSAKGFEKYCQQTPDHFRFGLKVTERITIWRYPKLPRYGKEAGQQNAHFLDVELFKEKFLEPLRPYAGRLGPLMLEFSQFYPGMIGSGTEFVERLDAFLGEISEEREFQFAVEMRNANWLVPSYFECLSKNRTSHVHNAWTRMPELGEQLELSSSYNLPSLVARLLLQKGTAYAEAVEAFSPYDRVQEPQPRLREAAAALLKKALSMGRPAYVFVNNRAEGSAPLTIASILDLLDL